ncbi:MAG TPA: ribonuclease III [Bacteroidota bacterium]|nr:ribonuclease III [Bacteroidota bacterium]
MNSLRRFLIRLSELLLLKRPAKLPPIDFSRLESALRYKIRDKQLFREALSHRSYLHVAGTGASASNERLEFLGDAVLNLVIAEYLFRADQSAREGDLTKVRSRLVNRKALTVYAQHRNISEFLLISPSALQIPGRGMETILSDAFEALIGAIYLDSGYASAKEFVEGCLEEVLETGDLRVEDENFKSQLLELSQSRGLGFPRYVTIREEGPDHDRTFTIEVMLGSQSYGVGFGKNKKDAEQGAAERALQLIDAQDRAARIHHE